MYMHLTRSTDDGDITVLLEDTLLQPLTWTEFHQLVCLLQGMLQALAAPQGSQLGLALAAIVWLHLPTQLE